LVFWKNVTIRKIDLPLSSGYEMGYSFRKLDYGRNPETQQSEA
jgi:hypothetical protein